MILMNKQKITEKCIITHIYNEIENADEIITIWDVSFLNNEKIINIKKYKYDKQIKENDNYLEFDDIDKFPTL